jgi:hypothetical protein
VTNLLFEQLGAFRRRCRFQAGAVGLIVGFAIGAAVVLIARPFLDGVPRGLIAWLAGPTIGLVTGFLWPVPWNRIARRVDNVAGLKDSITTGLEFSVLVDRQPIHDLQLKQATERLSTLNPSRVFPLRVPSMAYPAFASWIASGALLLFSPNRDFASPENPLPHVLEASHRLEEIVKELQLSLDELILDEADSMKKQRLIEVAKKLEEIARDLREPGTDACKALSKIAEVEREVENLLKSDKKDIEQKDAGFKTLGEAMANAKPLETAGKALQSQQYRQAARSLNGVKSESLDARDRRSLREDLSRAAAALEQQGQKDLGKIAKSFADNSEQEEEFKKSAQELAKQAREQEDRKRINRLTARLHKLLTECKNQMQERSLAESVANPHLNPNSAKNSQNTNEKKEIVVPSTEQLREQMKDPKFREKIERIFRATDGDGGDAVEEKSIAGDSPEKGNRMSSAPATQRRFEQRLEDVIQREKVPLMYQDAVRRYFAEMMKGSKSDPVAP